ncbi:MAG: GTP-binding protein [Candidatus Lokiarchaeota archaeon]|nr:GTP-binding protein [Candidatus Lokiarchaeota archaeon]
MVIRVKITILGESNVGKTSLVSKYCKNRFPSEYRATLGADFTTKSIKYQGKSVELILWDIAGNEVADYYLEGTNGYLLVFDLTSSESFKKLTQWYEKGKRICGNIPFLVLGNKKDLEEFIVVSGVEYTKRIKKQYNSILIETSAKTGFNVENAFLSILELILGEEI